MKFIKNFPQKISIGIFSILLIFSIKARANENKSVGLEKLEQKVTLSGKEYDLFVTGVHASHEETKPVYKTQYLCQTTKKVAKYTRWKPVEPVKVKYVKVGVKEGMS